MLDELIKYNCMRGSKAVIDIGTDSTKILDIHYEAKEISIREAHLIKVGYNGESSFREIARKVEEKISGRQRKDIIIVLPSSITESKIVSVKNKKTKDARRIVHKQCKTFGKSSPSSRYAEYTLMGTREEQGDTVAYYLLSSVQKGILIELFEAFEFYDLKITRVVNAQFNQVCLSEVFADDFDSINRILVDFGNTESRITVFADKIAVYSRTIPIGFQSYVKKMFDAKNDAGKKEIISALISIGDVDVDEGTAEEKLCNIGKSFYYESVSEVNKQFFKEFARIIDMCGNSDIEVSKVYISGFVINGFVNCFMNNTEIDCEYIRFENGEHKAGHGITIDVQTEKMLNSRFTNAVGLSFCPLL